MLRCKYLTSSHTLSKLPADGNITAEGPPLSSPTVVATLQVAVSFSPATCCVSICSLIMRVLFFVIAELESWASGVLLLWWNLLRSSCDDPSSPPSVRLSVVVLSCCVFLDVSSNLIWLKTGSCVHHLARTFFTHGQSQRPFYLAIEWLLWCVHTQAVWFCPGLDPRFVPGRDCVGSGANRRGEAVLGPHFVMPN